MDEKYLIPLITAVITSLISALIAVYIARKQTEKEISLTEQKLRHEYKTEFTVETAVRKLMQKGFALRSFSLIKHHVRGFEDDELKQLLLRSGCICFRVIKGIEYWGLLEENEELLPTRNELEKEGMQFYD